MAMETPAEEFSFPDDFFAEHKGDETAPPSEEAFVAAAAEAAPSAAPVETAVPSSGEELVAEPEPFDFGSFDFGVAAPVETTPPETEKPQQEATTKSIFFSAPPESQTAVPGEIPPLVAEEPPPVSTAVRRRGSQSLPVAVLAVAIVLILALVGGGYYFFTEGPAALNKLGLGFMAKWVGIETAEEGNISLKNPVGSFVINQEAGEIFVVTGEAVNNFKKPRASIQVKATLFGSKGEVLQQKTVYAGNLLSKEQLGTLPMAKIEETMNNQFGDSLANLGVQPGKGIPFVAVFSKVPKEAADYGVEVVGSTVAGQQ
jgi:hypothetical protein